MNFSFLKIKNKSLIFLIIIALFFISLPSQTKAAWYDYIISAFTYIPSLFLALIFYVFALITLSFASFAKLILTWVTSPDFISLSYTKPGFNVENQENPIIALGLSITKNFTNMILLLILVYIALATILRLSGYETKKLFIKFIVVALLVNFSPILCGFIVDVSNIIMNYFLKDIRSGEQFVNYLGSITNSAVAGFSWQTFKMGGSAIPVVAYLLMIGIFNLLLAFILLLYALIFSVRYAVIWILVILSPLAFAAFILPNTKRFFDSWWNQFLQWSFIGAVAAFFIFLGEHITALGPEIFKPKASQLGAALLPFAVPLIFLYLGLIFGFSTSAIGASTVINFGKKYGRKGYEKGRQTSKLAGKWAARKVLTSPTAEKLGIKKKLTDMAALSLPGFKGKTALGKVLTTAGYASGVTPFMWMVKRGLGKATLKLTEDTKRDIIEGQKEYAGKEPITKLAAIKSPIASTRLKALLQAIEEEEIDDLKKLGLSNDEIINIGKEALKISPTIFKKIRDAFPHLAEEMANVFSEETQKAVKVNLKEAISKGYSGVMERLIAEMSPYKIPKMDSSIFFDPNTRDVAFEAAQKNWQAGHWAEAGKAFGKKFCDEVRNQFLTNPQNFTESARTYFLHSPAGRSLYGV